INEYDVRAPGHGHSIYFTRQFAARTVRLDRIADEAADDLALVIRDEIGDVDKPYDSRRLFHPEAHWVVGHAHHRFRHAQGRFPLVASLHLAPRHTGEGDLRAARKTFDPVRHD